MRTTLAFAALVPALLSAQGAPARDSAVRSNHSIRNGAIMGAMVGIAAGVYGGSKIGTGCLISSSSCDSGHKQRAFMVDLGAVGGVAGALAGAVVGKVVAMVTR